ncbi:unnamed protein product [Durusdinium trenchii]|uniref:Uncharacterized protein n=1 Tax=Durusdinium trenchii TaxID=1381693 RepID=A0ABP0QKK2_9DINO
MPRTTSRANALRAGTGPRIFSLLLVLGVGLAYSGLVAFCSFQPSQAQGARISRRAEGSGTTLEKPKAGSEWRLGVGRAIDVLRRDVAGLFSRKRYTPDFSIYSPDIEVTDARLPSFKIKGLASYQQVLSTLQWSVRTACDRSNLEITSRRMNSSRRAEGMRWMCVLQDVRSMLGIGHSSGAEVPFIVEGYSRYEFDPWSAAIVKHTIDITNPPMYLSDLMASYASPSWLTVSPQLGMPSLSAWPATATTASGSHTGAALLTGGSAVAGTMGTGRNVSGLARRAGGMFPGFPQGCEDDFECNDGKANFPLQCCEMPLLGKFCCEPPDDFATGVPNEMPAYVPLPVPVDPLDQ